MSTGDHKCIRYLMKEMDPSEELEFEQQIREDENLLIEVESLRAITKKVSKLSAKNPPESLTQKIAYDAKQIQSERIKESKTKFIIKKGLAAAVIFSALTGGYYFMSKSPKVEQFVPAVSDTVSPWVDRNEVLKYSNLNQSVISPVLDSEYRKSYDKLELVKYYDPGRNQNAGIHLTGTTN